MRPRWVTPNKLFDYMFAGMPVLVNFAGTTADLIEEVGAGAAPEAGSPTALAAQLEAWADDPEAAKALGARGREVAYARFDRRAVAKRMAEIFADVVADGPR